MSTHPYALAGLILVAVVVAVVVGLSVYINFRSNNQVVQTTAVKELSQRSPPGGVSEAVLRDLKDCLHLINSVTRHAGALSVSASNSADSASSGLENTAGELRKLMNVLTARLQQLGFDTSEGTLESTVGADRPGLESLSQAQPKPSAGATSARSVAAPVMVPRRANGEREARKFGRSACPGSFKATIYPPPFKSGDEPVQCTLLMRDLSCGGIGVSHSERLHPRQIIVVHAVTRLLIGEVRWCRQVSERSYIAGCQLVKAGG